MSHSDIYRIGLLLSSLILMGLVINPVMGLDNLSITKTAKNGNIGDHINWTVNLTNTGTEVIKNITVYENLSCLKNVTYVNVTTNNGTYTDGNWTIPSLAGEDSAYLTIDTVFSYPERQTNCVNITSINGSAPSSPINTTGNVDVNGTVATLVIKPETLNLKSKGVFTVFINVTGVLNETDIDLDNTSINCSGAELKKLIPTGEDGQIIAKFYRTGLDVTANDSVTISCMGNIKMDDGSTIHITGSDTIRVINPPESFLDKIMKFFGLKHADVPENETFKNPGEGNQYIKNISSQGSHTVDSDNEVTEEGDESQELTHGGKPEKEPNGNTPPLTECNQGNCKGGKNK